MFLCALLIATIYTAVCGYISLSWLDDLQNILGYPIAVYLILFLALIPGFFYMLCLTSHLLHSVKSVKKQQFYPDLTVIIPTYNTGSDIIDCIISVFLSEYAGKIRLIVADDGSDDDTVAYINEFDGCLTLLRLRHKGKCFALNEALKYITTEFFVTVDSDTILEKNALTNITDQMLSGEYAAVAGALMPKNMDDSFITKIQGWDYSIGIFGIKLLQSYYHSTLVAQGAFSIYRTSVVRELDGWRDCIGEDIVLTWAMLKKGYKTSFSAHALALTDVPNTFESLFGQRKRWARGMIESFKKNKGIVTNHKTKICSRVLIACNVLFPFIDLAVSVFVPLGITLALFDCYLIVGPVCVLLIPLTILATLLINGKYKRAMKKSGCEMKRRSLVGLLGFLLLYQLILSPVCLLSYLRELLYSEKRW